MDEMMMSRVFVRVDQAGRIVQIEGEYSLCNLDLTDPNVVQIDQGVPCDRLNHAQTAYLEGGVWTEDGIPRWTLEDGEPFPVPVLRSEDDIQADRDARPAPPPTAEEQLRADVDYLAVMAGVTL